MHTGRTGISRRAEHSPPKGVVRLCWGASSEEVCINCADVTAAIPTASGSLADGELRLNDWSDDFRDKGAEQPPETLGELKRPLAVHRVSMQLFPDPQEEIQIRTENPVKKIQGAGSRQMGLSQQKSDKPDAIVEKFIWLPI